MGTINSDMFYAWFKEYTGSDTRYTFGCMDNVFDSIGEDMDGTKQAIIDSGLKGEEVIEYIEMFIKL